MADELLQPDNPLSDEEWNTLQEVVVRVARRRLVGRRFIDLYGPLGPGVQTVKSERYVNATPGGVDYTGDASTAPISVEASRYVPIPIIYKDFQIHWRDLAAARRFGVPLDTSACAGAASFCAGREDQLLFHGEDSLGIEGLLSVNGSNTLQIGNWEEPGSGFEDVVQATRLLNEGGHYGPYAMAVSPKRFAQLHRLYERTGVLEVKTIRDLITDGIYQSDVLKDDEGVIVATGYANFDLALSMDLRVAYLGEENLNLRFRVLECALLRIKHPDAICVFKTKKSK
ncbi:MAG: family 1 encapsulin nanocompartment shell protein [Planctomycetota bacterium JB042]